MVYIKSIRNKSNNILPKDFYLKCDQINLLVGDQGVGKSTLLKLLNKHDKSLTVELNEYTFEHGVDTFYFDTEKDNPRVNDLNRYSNDGFKYKDALMSHFQSHGEVLVNFTVEALYKAKDCIIFLDEPEASLSIRNQFRLAEAVNKAALNGCQLFIATHCYPLIQAYHVFSFEDNALIKGEEYLKKFYEQDTPTNITR